MCIVNAHRDARPIGREIHEGKGVRPLIKDAVRRLKGRFAFRLDAKILGGAELGIPRVGREGLAGAER